MTNLPIKKIRRNFRYPPAGECISQQLHHHPCRWSCDRFAFDQYCPGDGTGAQNDLGTGYPPYFILGSGSNLLVSDSGYDGIILHNRAHNIKVNTKVDPPPLVTAETGAGLGQFAQMASRRGVGGFEWANSIPPGTVGGAVYGNAGAHGSDVAENCRAPW